MDDLESKISGKGSVEDLEREIPEKANYWKIALEREKRKEKSCGRQLHFIMLINVFIHELIKNPCKKSIHIHQVKRRNSGNDFIQERVYKGVITT